jgi:hypothetical protein
MFLFGQTWSGFGCTVPVGDGVFLVGVAPFSNGASVKSPARLMVDP